MVFNSRKCLGSSRRWLPQAHFLETLTSLIEFIYTIVLGASNLAGDGNIARLPIDYKSQSQATSTSGSSPPSPEVWSGPLQRIMYAIAPIISSFMSRALLIAIPISAHQREFAGGNTKFDSLQPEHQASNICEHLFPCFIIVYGKIDVLNI
ncbi:hypothetical protein BOTCAL_0483g00030 [Botryotinia calthae]|uniref:Uncharacterized protein n=1 Tax=Botryotinia calthae TaxID=38488 RepID=A0A4Y8CLX3_9HELO|nr:hypothetical protein BOTCAL_0483g00030 [Botryotinia calthae]